MSFICPIHNYISSEMCSLHLTHPSARTPGEVGSRRCGARGAVGGSVPCSRVSPQSWTILPEPRFKPTTSGSSPTLYPLEPRLPLLFFLFVTYTIIKSITSSEMCSLHLTHPSAHTWSSGQPTLWCPGSSWGFGASLKGPCSIIINIGITQHP